MTLDLTTTREFHFEKNAATAAASLQVALDGMRDISNRYNGSNDDRAEVELWKEAIIQRAHGLLNVDGDDAVAKAASILWQEQAGRFMGFIRDIMLYKPNLSSGDDYGESRPLLKKIRRALDNASDHVGEFSRRKDTRESIIRELEQAKKLGAELLLLEEPIDRWQIETLTQRCDSFLSLLREPLRTEPEPAAVEKPIYLKHHRIGDELEDLISRLSWLYNPKLGFAEDAKLVSEKAREARQIAKNAVFTDHLDNQAIRARLEEMQSVLRRFTIRPDATPGAAASIRESMAYTNTLLVKVLAMLGPVPIVPAPATLATRVGRALARSN